MNLKLKNIWIDFPLDIIFIQRINVYKIHNFLQQIVKPKTRDKLIGKRKIQISKNQEPYENEHFACLTICFLNKQATSPQAMLGSGTIDERASQWI